MGRFLEIKPDELNAYAAAFAALVALAIPLTGLWWKFLTRPRLAIDFSNKIPWCRLAEIEKTSILARWVRVRVTNKGWTAARVSGRLAAMLDQSGAPLEEFDPVALHWVGTPYGPGESMITLLPGQTEFLDVVRFDWNRRVLKVLQEDFSLVLQDTTARGLPPSHPLEGQTLRVVVLSEYTYGAAIELKLPGGRYDESLSTIFTMALMHRPVDAWTGLGLVPWDTDTPSPPTRYFPTIS